MKGFYDQIVPQVANDILKKLGGANVAIADAGTGSEQPGFDITPAMLKHVEQGLPLFKRNEQPEKSGNPSYNEQADKTDIAAVDRLNRALRKYFGNDDYGMVLQSGRDNSVSRNVQEALGAAFGKRVIAVAAKPGGKDAFNGFSIPGSDAVFVNVNGNAGFIQIAGHELYHEIERARPDLIKWYADNALRYIKDLPAYRDRLNNLLQPGEKAYSNASALRELLADFMGDSLADPVFLRQLADSNPGKFKQFVNKVRIWLTQVANKLKGLKSDQYVTDVKELQKYLGDVLNAYVDGKPVDSVTGRPEFSRSAMKSVDANVLRGKQAMNQALLDRTDVKRAMYHNELGWIDFVWGDDRRGIQHIVKQRLEKDGMESGDIYRLLTKDVVDAIASGTVIRKRIVAGSIRVVVGDERREAVLVRNTGANGWVLNGWNVKTPDAIKKANDFKKATPPAADSSDNRRVAGVMSSLSDIASKNVKSETGGVLFSRMADTKVDSVWNTEPISKLHTFLYHMQDKQIDTKRIVEAIKKNAGEIADELNTYVKEALYHGRTANN